MRDERGSALAMGVLFLGIVIGGTFIVMKQSQDSSDKASGEIKFLQGKTESKKVFAIAGYLISNNLILCKSTPWSGGQSKNQCKWVGQKAEETYKHDEFGLSNLRYVKDGNESVLTFDLISGNDESRDYISRYPGTLSFRLIDASKDDSLSEMLGEIPEDVKELDKDRFFVKSSLVLKVPMGGEKAQSVTAASLFKRPLAVPKVEFLSSSCLSQCNSLRGEHSYPSCRGPFFIDGEATTDIVAITENEGPGVIYDLAYEREVNFVQEVEGVSAPVNRAVSVPFSDFIPPFGRVEWVDRVKCATFVQNITKQVTKIETKRGSGPTTVDSEVVKDEQTISQHSEPAGSVNYSLDTNSQYSRIEPFRLSREVANFDGDIGGKLEKNEKTVETTITIYVEPPH